MKLYLLRHGKAVEREAFGREDDASRPLTNVGRERTRLVAEGMRQLGLEFDLILSSPLVRARQTAEIVAETYGATELLRFTERLADEKALVDLTSEIRSLLPQPESLLLVGHEPNLGEFVSLLLGADSPLPLRFKKAGLCCLSVESIEAGPCAVLEWLLAPRQLRLFANSPQ
jgi:phosphohistidine phosphatase